MILTTFLAWMEKRKGKAARDQLVKVEGDKGKLERTMEKMAEAVQFAVKVTEEVAEIKAKVEMKQLYMKIKCDNHFFGFFKSYKAGKKGEPMPETRCLGGEYPDPPPQPDYLISPTAAADPVLGKKSKKVRYSISSKNICSMKI